MNSEDGKTAGCTMHYSGVDAMTGTTSPLKGLQLHTYNPSPSNTVFRMTSARLSPCCCCYCHGCHWCCCCMLLLLLHAAVAAGKEIKHGVIQQKMTIDDDSLVVSWINIDEKPQEAANTANLMAISVVKLKLKPGTRDKLEGWMREMDVFSLVPPHNLTSLFLYFSPSLSAQRRFLSHTLNSILISLPSLSPSTLPPASSPHHPCLAYRPGGDFLCLLRQRV